MLTDAQAFLSHHHDGAFVVYQPNAANPALRLAIKSQAAVRHEDILVPAPGKYQLKFVLAPDQPVFDNITALVEHYTTPQHRIPFTLDRNTPCLDLGLSAEEESANAVAFAADGSSPKVKQPVSLSLIHI